MFYLFYLSVLFSVVEVECWINNHWLRNKLNSAIYLYIWLDIYIYIYRRKRWWWWWWTMPLGHWKKKRNKTNNKKESETTLLLVHSFIITIHLWSLPIHFVYYICSMFLINAVSVFNKKDYFFFLFFFLSMWAHIYIYICV